MFITGRLLKSDLLLLLLSYPPCPLSHSTLQTSLVTHSSCDRLYCRADVVCCSKRLTACACIRLATDCTVVLTLLQDKKWTRLGEKIVVNGDGQVQCTAFNGRDHNGQFNYEYKYRSGVGFVTEGLTLTGFMSL